MKYLALRRGALTFAIGLAIRCGAHHVLAGDAAAGESPAQRAEALVNQLGDPSFAHRQHATRELEQLGRLAKPALLTGLKSRDAEVRLRCRRLLAVVLDLDLQARIAAFAADTTGQAEHDLPGWTRFQEHIGTGSAARELFVEMLNAEPQIIEAADGNPRLVGALLQARCEQLQQSAFEADARQRRLVSLGCVAALFFVGSSPEVAVNDTFVSYLHTFSYQPSFQAAMLNRERAEPLRRILGLWISRPSGTINSYQNFMLSLQFDLKEGLAPALAMLHDGAGQPHMTQYAMLLVGKFSGKDSVPLLAPFLEDHSPLGTYSVNGLEVRAELRDVALAVLVHLTGQEHAMYGFDHLQRNNHSIFLPVTAGFSDPAKREAALQRWKTWLAAHATNEN